MWLCVILLWITQQQHEGFTPPGNIWACALLQTSKKEQWQANGSPCTVPADFWTRKELTFSWEFAQGACWKWKCNQADHTHNFCHFYTRSLDQDGGGAGERPQGGAGRWRVWTGGGELESGVLALVLPKKEGDEGRLTALPPKLWGVGELLPDDDDWEEFILSFFPSGVKGTSRPGAIRDTKPPPRLLVLRNQHLNSKNLDCGLDACTN